MHPRDDLPDGQRRMFRRLEDSVNANQALRLGVVERLLVKHESWFQDLGVGNMSLDQRQALPITMERTIELQRDRDRWRKRTIGLVGFAGFAGSIVAVLLEHALAMPK